MAKHYAIVEHLGGPCQGCGIQVPGDRGPIGWDGEGPVCDTCLLQAEPKLGAILNLRNLAGELGADPGLFESEATAKALARIFEGYSKTYGPVRPTGTGDLIRFFARGKDPALTEFLLNLILASAKTDEEPN